MCPFAFLSLQQNTNSDVHINFSNPELDDILLHFTAIFILNDQDSMYKH